MRKGSAMPVDRGKIDELERQLAEAKAEFLREGGKKFEILQRIIPEEEMQRYLSTLTDRQERVLFGLDLPEEPKRRGRPAGGGKAPAKSGGDQVCPICGKSDLTERGLRLHITRMHKGEGAGGGDTV